MSFQAPEPPDSGPIQIKSQFQEGSISQAAGYGSVIPNIWGKSLVEGNVLWVSDITTYSKDAPQVIDAGKSSTVIHNYTYHYIVNIAIALCEGPINSIRKMWIGEKVVFDMEYTFPSGLLLYTGSESQTPDPTIEAFVGVGNVPAFKGLAYAVFTNLEILQTAQPQATVSLPSFKFLVDGSKTTVHEYSLKRSGQAFNARMFKADEDEGVYDPIYYPAFSDSDAVVLKRAVSWGNSMIPFTYAQIVSDAQFWADNYPDKVTKEIYGQSYGHYDLIGLRIFDDGRKPIIGFSQGIHGDEISASKSMSEAISQLLTNPNADPVITYIQQNFTVVFALTINPDGMVAVTRNNSNNVNINRNWPYYWVDTPDTDKGASAASEPEVYNFIAWATPFVSRVITWCDIHGWNTQVKWGFLTEQIFHDTDAQRTMRSAYLYTNDLLAKRDYTGHTIVNGTPTLTEFRSHHKPYIYTWVRGRCRTDAWCGLMEYPQTENTYLISTVFLDLFKGCCMAASDAIQPQVGSFLINPSQPVPLNNNSFMMGFNDAESRPDWFTTNGLRITHFNPGLGTNDARAFIRSYRPPDVIWPKDFAEAGYSYDPINNSCTVIGGNSSAGQNSVVNTEYGKSNLILTGSPALYTAQSAAACHDTTHVYYCGGFDTGYKSDVIRAPIPGIDLKYQFWEVKSSLPEGIQRHTCHRYNGKLIIVGGRNSAGYLSEVYSFNVDTGVKTTIGNMSQAKGWHTSTIVGNELFVFGGWDGISTKTTIEKMNLTNGTVTILTPLPFSRAQQAIAVYNGQAFLCCGRSGSTTHQTIYIYDFAANTVNEWVYSIAALTGDESDPESTIVPQGPDVNSPAAYFDTTDLRLIIIGGQHQDSSFSGSVFDIDLGDSTMYPRRSDVKKWGYLRVSSATACTPGEYYNISMSVRNVDPINDYKNPYVRLVVYIGPVVAPTRKIKLGYMVPPQKSEGYYTYNIPFKIQAGETEFRVYIRHYSGDTTVDIKQFQIIKSKFSLTPNFEVSGRNADTLTVKFRESINNPRYFPPNTVEGTFSYLAGKVYDIGSNKYGTNLQIANGAVSPIWGCQMDLSIKIFTYNCEPGLDLDAAELWYESTEDSSPTIDPVTGSAIYSPNGRLFLKYRFLTVWYDVTLFSNIPLNFARFNREYRRDIISWYLKTYRGKIDFGFYFYGSLKVVSIPGDTATNPYYSSYSFRCYGVTATSSGVFMRASRNLSSILQELCVRSGLTVGDVDVTGVSGSVTGYLAASKSDIRSYIDPLKDAFLFDYFDGEKLVFKSRSEIVDDTITLDELINTGDWPYKYVRQQQKELPNRVAIIYIDEDRKYENNTQYANRSEEYGLGENSITVPIVMNADAAAQVAERTLINTWVSRNVLTFNVPISKLFWEIGDNIRLVDGAKTFTVMLTSTEESGSMIKCEAVNVSGIATTSNASGSTGLIPTDVLNVNKSSIFLPLDIPIVRDIDDDSGFYYTVSNDLNDVGRWQGAAVDRSLDAGVTYQSVAFSQNAAIYGVVATATPAPARFTVWDDKTVITVVLNQGTLSSFTKADVLLNSFPFAVLGSEIIAFATATLIATNTYQLKNLLRGQFGTTNEAANHVTNEKLILLKLSTIRRFNPGISDLFTSRLYRTATVFTDPTTVTPTSFTNTGIGLRPYPVANFNGTRNATPDIILKWTRCGRVSNQWNNGTEVPLGEDAEKYEIDVVNGSNVVIRTITGIVTPTYTYLNAMHITDFGSIQSSIKFRVYQMSGQVGRGSKSEVLA